jgi:mono/diheme cytochrome c family protein
MKNAGQISAFGTTKRMRNTPLCLIAVSSYLLTFMFMLSSCSRDRNNPGYSYLSDMSKSEAYKYYSANPVYTDRKLKRITVFGTIPRGFEPYTYPKTIEGQRLAGKELVNPVSNSPENIKIGKVMFDTICSMCHGKSGTGKGYLVTTRKFKRDVTSLVSDYVQNKPDGEIFHVITLGTVSGFMGSHSEQLKPDDRWRIVRYIRTKFQNPVTVKNVSKGL